MVSMSVARTLAFAVLGFGCATAGKDLGEVPIDAPKPVDSNQVTVDAPRFDAPMIDAAIDAPMIDAGPGGTCTNNAGCTFPGECCFTLGGGAGICTPGTVFAGSCFPE
ncbi:MAG: hypothetical protein H0T42_23870 [Deltaproteobacteria bacterium]|nr:hypothetical protein [Deltaproteobacteria bacterium]